MKFLWQLYKESSMFVKFFILSVLMVWVIAVAGMATLLFFTLEKQAVAQPPAPQSVFGAPVITLQPAGGPANSPVKISGQNWMPGTTVFIYLNPFNNQPTNDFAIDSVVVDAAGRFEAAITIPAGADFVKIIARPADSGLGAEALFSLTGTPLQEPVVIATVLFNPPTPTPTQTTSVEPVDTPTPQPAAPQLATSTDLNVRSGPGLSYPILGLLKTSQTANITGLSPDGKWWQITFSGAADGRGWVAAQYVTAQNIHNVLLVQPQPLPVVPTATSQPAPSPVVITDWRGEYYANPNLTGSPALVRNDAAINFNWGSNSPAPGLPADNFSARWSRSLYFSAGSYRFTVQADDGVLFWIDDNLLIDQWRDTSAASYSVDVNLTDGQHSLKLAYFDRTGDALIRLQWEGRNSYPDWKGEYFSNRNLSGSPLLVRNDPNISFNWGGGSPGAGLPVDNFSARWTRDAAFAAGTYRFTITVDDGVRLWLDGRLVLDQWRDSSPTSYTAEVNLTEGIHNLRLEYYDRQDGALVQLGWNRVESYPDWKAEYFDNRKMQGNPVLVRNDAKIEFNWGSGSPGSQIPSDNFSACWSRKVDMSAGTYLFQMKVDDGARLWLDEKLIIDGWQDGSLRTLEASQKISQGQHRFKVEYYERGGGAQIELKWKKQDDPPPTNQPPQAVLAGPYTINEGSQLTFDGRASRDPDGSITLYEWDFNYNGKTFNSQASGPMVSNGYPDGPASSLVALRVTDNKGASTLATAQVTVQNVAPMVQIGGPYSGQTGSAISLVGSAIDAGPVDMAGLAYRWEFGDGAEGNGPAVSYAYAQAGTYPARLTVTDKDGGQSSKTTTVTVTPVNQPPQAIISGPASGFAGQPVTFSTAASTDDSGKLSYQWDLGDGTIATDVEVTHVYTPTGSYTINLVVTDEGGLSANAQHIIIITTSPPDSEEPPVNLIE